MNEEIIKAEQQLTGFSHAYQGFGIVSLIEAMNLQLFEWQELKENVGFMPQKLIIEIDDYFKDLP